jgi:hypothetical protein
LRASMTSTLAVSRSCAEPRQGRPAGPAVQDCPRWEEAEAPAEQRRGRLQQQDVLQLSPRSAHGRTSLGLRGLSEGPSLACGNRAPGRRACRACACVRSDVCNLCHRAGITSQVETRGACTRCKLGERYNMALTRLSLGRHCVRVPPKPQPPSQTLRRRRGSPYLAARSGLPRTRRCYWTRALTSHQRSAPASFPCAVVF